jgi:hypothetical protein
MMALLGPVESRLYNLQHLLKESEQRLEREAQYRIQLIMKIDRTREELGLAKEGFDFRHETQAEHEAGYAANLAALEEERAQPSIPERVASLREKRDHP